MTRKTRNDNAPALSADALTAFGKEMAAAAHDQTVQASNHWSRALTLYVPWQDAGKGEEALDLLFKAGKGNGQKAPWYRAYKSILTRALDLGVRIKAGMGAKEAQQAVQAKADGERTDEERLEAALLMAGRMILSLRERGVTDAQILAAANAAAKAAKATEQAAKGNKPKAAKAPEADAPVGKLTKGRQARREGATVN